MTAHSPSPTRECLEDTSLVDLPWDIQARIVPLLEHRDLTSLCLVHSTWVDAARSGIFRTLDTVRRGNDTLRKLVEHPSLLDDVQRHVRRVRSSLTPPTSRPERAQKQTLSLAASLALDASSLDAWLQERDELLARLVDRLQSLRVATVKLHYDSPYSTAFVNRALDRMTLTRFPAALAGKDRISCLKVDFGIFHRPNHLRQALQYPSRFLEILAETKYPCLTHLSFNKLALLDAHPRDHVSAMSGPPDATDLPASLGAFLRSLPALRHIQLDDVEASVASGNLALPRSIESLEVLDDNRFYHVRDVFALAQTLPALKHLRIMARGPAFEPAVGEELPSLRNVTVLVLKSATGADKQICASIDTLCRAMGAPALRTLSLPADFVNPLDLFNPLRLILRALQRNRRTPALERITMAFHGALRPTPLQQERWPEVQRQFKEGLGIELAFDYGETLSAWRFASAFRRLE